jgi:multiple sugar transport system ATP-binding protein
MSYIRFVNLGKSFGGIPAVNGISFTIEKGEFVTFLGPSGCGKTTTLRCLSGLESPEDGEIWVGDRCIFSRKEGINIPPGYRGLGLVFQNYALWPHMTVEQNVLFGLRKLKISAAEKKAKAAKILESMDLKEYIARYPHELSGGQQQRVAVARMVVTEPGILLFDEPLSNLDAKLRMKLRSELKRLHMSLGATSIYVTHDQVEALALSDKIVVMKDGTIQQIGTPYEVYHKPSNTFVADFMGNPETNLIEGRIVNRDSRFHFSIEGDQQGLVSMGGTVPDAVVDLPITLNVRPEDILIKPAAEGAPATFYVYAIQPMGSEVMVHLKSPGSGRDIIAKGPESELLSLRSEQKVNPVFRRGNVYDKSTGLLICSFSE